MTTAVSRRKKEKLEKRRVTEQLPLPVKLPPPANNYVDSLIDRLCDKLWAAGVTNPISYVEQISYLFFLKLLDEMEIENEREARITKRPHKSIFAGKNEQYRWSEWQHITEPKRLYKFVRDDVFEFMGKLRGHEEIRR